MRAHSTGPSHRPGDHAYIYTHIPSSQSSLLDPDETSTNLMEDVHDTNVSETTERKPSSTYGVGEPLTPQQRKMELVGAALEATGMGTYQWKIFFLCGFGYLLDLIWAHIFGLITPRIQIELGIPDSQYGDIFSVFSAGLTAGAFTWGILVDIVGRKWAFNLTVAITAIFGMCFGALTTWASMLAFTFFIGFGLGGNIPIDATIVLEFIPKNRRYLLAALSIFQPIGVIISSLISWGLVPKYACASGLRACTSVAPGEQCCTKASNYGWRYAVFCVGGISAIVFLARFVVFNFKESPRFLILHGRDAEAVNAIHAIAKTNGLSSTLTLDQLQACDDDASMRTANAATIARKSLRQHVNLSHLKLLFNTSRMAKLTILTWLVYAGDYFGFTIAGAFLPKLLAERGAEAQLSISETYRNYILTAFPGVFGVLLGTAIIEVPRLRQRWGMVITSALMGVSLMTFSSIRTPAASVGLNAMEYFFQSAFNAILYGWTPTVFPAAVRGSACGLSSFWGRLISIVAPIVAARAGSVTGIYLAGGGAFLCTVLAVFLPDTPRTDPDVGVNSEFESKL